MKAIFLLLSAMMCIEVHAVTCHSNPKVQYSGNAGISAVMNYENTASDYFKKIKQDYNKAKNCSIYASIHNDLRNLRDKSDKFLRDSKQSGLSNRSKRGKAARCLKSIYSKMI